MDPHAQWEIRQYANVIGHEIVARWVPIAWEAFKDYRLNSMSLSRIEVELLRLLISGDDDELASFLVSEQLVRVRNGAPVLAGELKEFLGKTPRFGAPDRIGSLLGRPNVLARFPS
jgi:thymidylate synthase (FAD)